MVGGGFERFVGIFDPKINKIDSCICECPQKKGWGVVQGLEY